VDLGLARSITLDIGVNYDWLKNGNANGHPNVNRSD
jgi:hypothetical protein